MNVSDKRVVIVGAGQAATQTAQLLRNRGFDGSIIMLGSEEHPPYQRPPLSKAFLKGTVDEQRLYFRPRSFYDDQHIEMHLASPVTEIDAGAGAVSCLDGRSFNFDWLVICTGSSPIRLPVSGGEFKAVYVLRNLDDAKAIRAALEKQSRVVVIGGGYIGLEAASAARQMNHEVTVVERLPRLLSRVTSPVVSEYYANHHRSQGVGVRLDTGVSEILGDGRVAGVRLDSGEEIGADIVLVGIGVRPNDQLAASAGIDCKDGVLVDPVTCQTSNPSVYAAGDCARQRFEKGSSLRLESVHNALVQADKIASHILGTDAPGFDAPWFWSDQFAVKIQTVGLFNDYDDFLVRGDMAEGKFSVLYLRDDHLIAIDSINDPVTFMAGRMIFRKGVSVNRAQIEDPDVVLKELANAARD